MKNIGSETKVYVIPTPDHGVAEIVDVKQRVSILLYHILSTNTTQDGILKSQLNHLISADVSCIASFVYNKRTYLIKSV